MSKAVEKHRWFLVALLALFIAAPNSTVLKYSTDSVDPYLFNTLRYGLSALITLPYLIPKLKLINKDNLKHLILGGFFMYITVAAFVLAIQKSTASYVSIVALITPIVFVILSTKMITGEKMTRRALAGISLAAAGAMLIVFLPVALRQNAEFSFYPLATALALINAFSYPLAVIHARKANEKGLPMLAVVSATTWVVFLLSSGLFLSFGNKGDGISYGVWAAALFSGVGVGVISTTLNTLSYERIGAIAIGALGYLEVFLSIIVAMVVLGEELAVTTVLGGVLILLGVYIVEHHKSAGHKHFHILKHH